MTFTDDLVYGVLIPRVKSAGGGFFLSYGVGAAPSLFYTRKLAREHRANCAFECKIPIRKMKVVKVKAEYTIL